MRESRLPLLWKWAQSTLYPLKVDAPAEAHSIDSLCRDAPWAQWDESVKAAYTAFDAALTPADKLWALELLVDCPQGVMAVTAACLHEMGLRSRTDEDTIRFTIDLLILSMQLYRNMFDNDVPIRSDAIQQWTIVPFSIAEAMHNNIRFRNDSYESWKGWEKWSLPMATTSRNFDNSLRVSFQSCAARSANQVGCTPPPEQWRLRALGSFEALLFASRLDDSGKLEVEQQLESPPYRCQGGDQACDESCFAPVYHELISRQMALSPELRVLQVGVCYGESLRAWAEWLLPVGGSVVGVDIYMDRFKAALPLHMERSSLPIAVNNIDVFEGDARSPSSTSVFRQLLHKYGPQSFDLIIDDGDHSHGSIESVIKQFFPSLLRPGGVYVVEDWHTAFKKGSSNFFWELSTELQSCTYVGNELNVDAQINSIDPMHAWVEGIEFRRNMVIVKKRFGLP